MEDSLVSLGDSGSGNGDAALDIELVLRPAFPALLPEISLSGSNALFGRASILGVPISAAPDETATPQNTFLGHPSPPLFL